VSAHESSGDMCYLGLDSLSPVTNRRYADLVLGGHAHYKQEDTIGGVKYVQWDGYGESTGSIKLTYDFASKKVVDSDTKVRTYYSNSYSNIDPTINQMIDDYLAISNPIASEVLSNNFSYFDTRSFSYLMCEAINDAVTSAGYTVDFSVCNYARKYFSGSTLTYGDLYKSFPFDNQIILMDVSGRNAYNSLRSNMTYRADINKAASSYGTFKVAVIDYIGLHQNSDREYDYFPNATNQSVFNPDSATEPPTYREILKEYILKDPTRIFNSENYTSSNPHFALD
jgi:2',3'-cyclic-nucleotide 2'-phosphodiesterase (5'-nucleotidase family)